MREGVLNLVQVFWIRCGCSGEGEGVVGVVACVLDKFRLFWGGCRCSGKGVDVVGFKRLFFF